MQLAKTLEGSLATRILFIVGWLFLCIAPQLLNYSFDFTLFVHDFNEVYDGGVTRTSKVLYHFALFAKPALFCFYFAHLKRRFKIDRLIIYTLPWFYLKECVDVIYCNNKTNTIEIEVISIIVIFVIGLLHGRQGSIERKN